VTDENATAAAGDPLPPQNRLRQGFASSDLDSFRTLFMSSSSSVQASIRSSGFRSDRQVPVPSGQEGAEA
jgi:hypothetical protein